MTKTQGYPGGARPFFTSVMEPGEIERPLARFPYASGDRVLITKDSDLSKELGTDFYDVPATLGYVYYNGFVVVYFDEPRADSNGEPYSSDVMRWSHITGRNA